MPKLHLKRTPEEEAAHILRKERRREKKRKRNAEKESSRKRQHEESERHSRKWASSDEDEDQYGPQPSSSKTMHEDDGAPDAEIEEQRFREKMFDALGDDERLDSLEARFNDYGHVPDRWRAAGSIPRGGGRYDDNEAWEGHLKMDPNTMDDEEYAEWIRIGMYRRTHAQEYVEQQRRKAEHAAKIAAEKVKKAETARLEKLAEEERRQRRLAKEARRQDRARAEYECRWKALADIATDGDKTGAPSLTFSDIPWPVFAAFSEKMTLGEMTRDEVASFLLTSTDAERSRKERKDKLREAILRYHPDKFEGRYLEHVVRGDREKVRAGIGEVVRALNALLAES
ncbi:hypothetical protein AX16_004009 [Volvariella volvacea WC 439]|nr:hypothetical protein AX16_004009 [Volvariella volvacea WC 439]